MKKTFIYTLFLFIVSCSNVNKTNINNGVSDELVKVGDKVLYFSDLPTSHFFGLTENDSLVVLNNFINEWISEEVLLLKAKEHVSNIKELKLEAANYEKLLINASYKKELVNSFEVTLTENDLLNYYEKHKNYFIFEEEYVALNYILIPKSTSNIAKIKSAISKNEESHWVDNYCSSNVNKCYLEKIAIKPLAFVTNELKLKKTKLIATKSFLYRYINTTTIMLYRIEKVYNIGDIAPMEIVENELKKLVLHSKKQEELTDTIEKIIQKAKNDKIIEKYIN